jgi:hypothetical protein
MQIAASSLPQKRKTLTHSAKPAITLGWPRVKVYLHEKAYPPSGPRLASSPDFVVVLNIHWSGIIAIRKHRVSGSAQTRATAYFCRHHNYLVRGARPIGRVKMSSQACRQAKRAPMVVSTYFVSATKTPFQSAGGAACWKACMRVLYKSNRPFRPKLCSAA